MKIAIIGGSGKMGHWFASMLEAEGRDVLLIGRDHKKLEESRGGLKASVSTDISDVETADTVIISVPVDRFEETIKKLSPHTRVEQIILDITSVKTLPVAVMHKYINKGRVLGTHPVFGPGARNLVNQNCVLTPTNQSEHELAQKVKDYLEGRGAKVSLMTPDQHDEMMAVILGLAHFIAIVSADSLAAFDRLKQMEPIGGVTYRVLLTLVESVISEDAGLYASLQMNLPHLPQFQQRFRQNCQEWAEIVKQKDSQRFVQRMQAIRQKLEAGNPDFGKSYDNMYRFAEVLEE